MKKSKKLTRRGFIKKAAVVTAAAPMIINSRAFGANDRICMGFIGMGGQGRGDLGGFLGFPQVQAMAVCDVVPKHAEMAKAKVDERNGNTDCKIYTDFREITHRDDLDAVFVATPDHWHAYISVDAMKHGKDVYCEKPETLTIREGRIMTETARRYGRVFSGGSQRVWGDYNWFHRMVRGGAIGEVQEAFVGCGGPSGPCTLDPVPMPEGIEWDLWLGPAPWRPYHPNLITGGFRPYRDYSGGGMTDWGCHNFGGALFTMNLHETGPVEVIPPDGKDVKLLTYVFANGVKMYHGGGWGDSLCFKGTEGQIPGPNRDRSAVPPDIHIPNYKGSGGIFGDFLHCVKTRERPFRDIEIAHRTATVAHLGNIAYWLQQPLKWDPVKEQIIGNPEASRWLDRVKRDAWTI